LTPVESVVFWVASVIAVLGGIGVVSSRSAIYSALSLIVTLSQLAVLYLLLNAQFIAAAQILIYAGAVMVLFLFVITLLGVQEYEFMGRSLPGQQLFSVIFGAILLLSVIYFVGQTPHALTAPHGHFNQQLAANNVGAFGRQLFTSFVFPFEATTLLLIVAMVGAVSLGRRQHGSESPTLPLDRRSLTALGDGGGVTLEPVASRPVETPAGANTEPAGAENDTRS
jgi:NADH-quinone oxidoreductase subunit J